MSYDLYLKPRSGAAIDPYQFESYFGSRPNYQADGSEALYSNEDTGVYFSFTLGENEDLELEVDEDGPDELADHPIAFNTNYFRPSYFIEEAEPEVTALVRTFDLVVSDPQMHGMGEGEYRADLLKSGWHHGNEFAYSAILERPETRTSFPSLPTETLWRAWSWNAWRSTRQQRWGETVFVPRVMFIELDGVVATTAVWPDGIPIAVPLVDYLIVGRIELAPRKLFRKVEDHVVIPFESAYPLLQRHGSQREDGVLVLNYVSPPPEVVRYVTSLPANNRQMKGVAEDKVLDRELVSKYSR